MMACTSKVGRRLTAVVMGGAVGLAAPVAEARERPRAPIVYMGQGSGASERVTPPPVSTPASAPQADPSSKAARAAKRIQFRYPQLGDRPQPVVDTAPAVRAPDPQPAPPPQRQQFAALPPQRAALPPATEYSLAGMSVEPVTGQTYDETGLASWYGPGFHGQPTANGEIFDQASLTAAHPSLPLPSLVHVTNTENGREIVVRVNDRGPFVEGRMIDLSHGAAVQLGFADAGEARVRVRYLGPAPVLAKAPVAPAPVQPVAPSPVQEVSFQPLSAPQPAAQSVWTYPETASYSGDAFGSVYVQLGAFSDIYNAERLSLELDGGLSVNIHPTRVNGADFFRVWVVPFASRAEATQTARDLAARGFPRGMLVEQH